MKLEIVGYRVNKCQYDNTMAPNAKMNIQISTNSQIKLPKEFRKGSVGSVFVKVLIGSQMHPLHLYMEMVVNFADLEAEEGKLESPETMMSLFKTICVPMALDQAEKAIDQLCKVYNIPPIKIPKNAQVQPKNNGFLN